MLFPNHVVCILIVHFLHQIFFHRLFSYSYKHIHICGVLKFEELIKYSSEYLDMNIERAEMKKITQQIRQNEYSINSTEYSFKHLTQSRIRSSTWPTQLSNRSGTTFWNIYPIPYLLGFKFFVGSNSCNPNFLTWYINIIRRELGLDFRTDVLINN